MNNGIIRVSESKLRNIIKESVYRILNEASGLISPEDAEAQGFAVSSKDQKIIDRVLNQWEKRRKKLNL